MTPPSPSREDQRADPAGPNASGPARFLPAVGPDAQETRSPLRVFGAAAALTLLLVGVPAALVWLAGPLSWPGSLPGRDDLTGSIGTEQVLAVLLVVAWLAWAQFALCVVVEIVAARRGGVLARPIPFSGPSQRLARTLVASVLVAGTIAIQSGTAFAATGAPPASAGPAARPVVASSAVAFAAGSAGSDQAVFAPGGVVSPETSPGPAISSPSAVTTNPAANLQTGEADESAATGADDIRLQLIAASDEDLDDADLDGRKVYVVESPAGRHHDSLWAIAEEHLGDGRRYKEIFDLNDGRPQPDGRTLHLARLIQPGWQLIMPDDATGVPRYVSRSGTGGGSTDSGSSADGSAGGSGTGADAGAAADAGGSAGADGSATAEPTAQPTVGATAEPTARSTAEPAAQATDQSTAQPTVQPTGASTPSLGGAGSAAASAAAAAGAAAEAAVPGLEASASAVPSAGSPAASTPAASTPAASSASSSSPAGSPAGSPATSAAASVPAGADPRATTADPFATQVDPFATQADPLVTGAAAPASSAATQTGQDRGLSIDWPGVEVLGAGLLGAGLLGALLLVRRRRGGVQPDDPAAEAEVWLRAGADADRSTLLDRALRTIRTSCEDGGVELPPVYGAVVDHEGIDLLLSVPQPGAPWPWRDGTAGMRWQLPIERSDDLPEEGESAYPLLASVGRDDQGRDALINLGAAGGPVTVLGSPAMASAVVRALALSLAGNPWSRGIEVLTCDLPETLPAIAAGRLISCPGAQDLTDQLEEGSNHLVRSGPAQVLTGGPAPGSRPERVAVYGQALPPAVAHRVEDLSRASGSQLAVLMTGELSAARWRLRVDDTGRLTCDELSLAVTAHRLGDGSVERLHSLFMAAAQPPARSPRTGGPTGRPMIAQPILESDDTAWAQAGARVAVLGEVEVRATGAIEPGREETAAEMVAYLALHPAGVHPAVLGSAIWPRGVPADVRDATIEVVRDWMGTDPDGQYRVRTGHDGRLRLSPNVVLDWDVLRTLLARADAAAGSPRERDLLVRALHLVCGPVAGGPGAGAYSWLARTDLERQAQERILDAADRLAQICADENDHVGVANAAASGLRTRPDAQHLWRHILRAEYALSGPNRLQQVLQNMGDALAQEGVDIDAQTQALVDHLQAPTGSIPTVQHRNSAS